MENLDIEIIVWAVNATTQTEAVESIAPLQRESDVKVSNSLTLFDPALGEAVQSSKVKRATMTPGDRVTGPAAITEDETTIILPTSRWAMAQSDGCIDVMTKNEEAE